MHRRRPSQCINERGFFFHISRKEGEGRRRRRREASEVSGRTDNTHDSEHFLTTNMTGQGMYGIGILGMTLNFLVAFFFPNRMN